MKEEICKKGIKKGLIRVILSLATVVTFLHLSSINVYAADVEVSTWDDFKSKLSSTSNGDVIILTGDLTATSSASFNVTDVTRTIDLNGHTIDLNGNNYIRVEKGTLIIKDSSAGEGKITGCNAELSQALLVDRGAKLVLKSGSITGNAGYGIYLSPPSSQFEMTGGCITGNKTNLTDGRNNYETTVHPEYVKLLGGEITGADIGVNVRALTLGGSIKIKDNKKSGEDKSLWLWKSTMSGGVETVIKLDGSTPPEGMEVYVYTDKDNSEAVILKSGDYVAGDKSYFYPADTLYREIVRKDNDDLVLRYKPASHWSKLTASTTSMTFDNVSIEEAFRFAKDKMDGGITEYNCGHYLVVYQMATGGKYKVIGFKYLSPNVKAVPYELTLSELKEFADKRWQQVWVVGTVTEGTLAHNWAYSVGSGEDVNKLTASCEGYSCGLGAHNVSLTLNANDANYSGNPYTGASLGGTSDWTDVGIDLTLPEIKYVGRGSTTYEESTTAPTAIGTYTAMITVGGQTATKDFAITAKTSSSDSESNKVFVDLDTNKSEVPYGTVFMHNKDNVRNIFDMKVHSVDARTKANQEFLAASYAKNQGKRARVLITTGIYPRNKLYAKDLGDKKFLSFVNLEKKVQPVYAVCYNQTDKAYYLTGLMNANGTAVFPDFIANEATNITVFVLE